MFNHAVAPMSSRASIERHTSYVCMSSTVKSEWWICPLVLCQAATRRARRAPTVWPQISLSLASSLWETVSFDFQYPLQEIMNELKYY